MFLRPSRQVRQLLPVAKESGNAEGNTYTTQPCSGPGRGAASAFIFFLSLEDSRAFFLKKPWSGFFPGVFFIRRAPAASENVLRNAGTFSGGRICARSAVCFFQRESISIRPTEKRFVSTYGFTKLRQRRVKPGTCYRQGNVFGACMTLRDCKRRGWGELAAVASSVRSAVRKAPEKEMCTCLALMPAHDGQPLA